jgi:hypothetical protein
MGFKQPKIDKNDINGSLEKAMKNIEKVAETKWPFEKGNIKGKEDAADKTPFGKKWDVIMDSTFMKDLEEKKKADKVNKEYDAMIGLVRPAKELYTLFILEKNEDETKTAVVNEYKKNLDNIITSGPIVIELINKLKKTDEIKEADDGVKDILKYITCLVKQWIAISEAIKKATADDDEKPKKKKKTKKKSADEDEDKGEDEADEEKPKKKPKNKKKPADDDDE